MKILQLVRFDVPTVASMMFIFWAVALVEIYRSLKGRPEDGGNKHLRKVGEILPNCATQ
jgi:hypothetical protein